MKVGIVVFPGTNCDIDTYRACEEFGWTPEYIWHDESVIKDFDVIFLPGGFSYGDYIRSGRLAKFSPIMQAVTDYVNKKRGMVVGICNGFQILCESGLLPGVLTDNINNKFICDDVELLLLDDGSAKAITLPIAHGEGRYFADPKTLKTLEDKNMIFLKYQKNPNGSVEDIAGIYDRESMIMAMMPHPERAIFKEIGGTDGNYIFKIIERDVKNAFSCK